MKLLPHVVGLESCLPLSTTDSPPAATLVDSLEALIKFGKIHIFAVTFLYVTDGLEGESLLPARGEGRPSPHWVPNGRGVQMLARALASLCKNTGQPQ